VYYTREGVFSSIFELWAPAAKHQENTRKTGVCDVLSGSAKNCFMNYESAALTD
jgi:hypothetical protein